MITAVAARWLLTVAFAAAGLGAALPRRGHHGAADAAGPVPVVSCVVMCAALTAMTWRSEPAAAAWAQAAVFGCAALWSALDGLSSAQPHEIADARHRGVYQARYLLVSSVAARLGHSDASRVTTLAPRPVRRRPGHHV